jgi:PAS domain S-box-containing protein
MMQQKPIAGEIKIVRSDGTTVDVWHKGVPLTDSHGNFSGMLVYSRDVTERKDMEGTLRESKAQLRQVIDLVPHMIYAKDRDGRFLLANKTTAEGCGTSPEDMVDRTHQELHSPVVEEYEMYLKDDREVIDGGKIKFIPEENFTYPDGHTVVLETTKIPFTTTGIPAVLGVSVDITERKRAIETQLILQNIANAVNTSKDISELCVSIQKHLSKIIDTTNFLLGLYNEENDTLSFTFKVDEKDKYTSFPLGKTPTAYVIRTGKPLLATKKVIDELTKAGKVKMIGTPSEIWLGVPLKFDNEVVGIITVQSYDNASAYTPKDVKLLEFVSNQIAIGLQRKRAEEALKESKAKLQAVFDGVNDPMYVIDKNYRVVMTNKSLLELKNISQGEAIGNYCYEVYHDRKERCKACAVQKVFETRDIAKVETSFSVPDGSFRFFEVYGYPLFDENGDVYQVLETTRDITDRKLLEEELLQSQKMEAIGTLAGGIAHDFNNLLTGILVNCDLLLDKVSEKATYKENIEEIYRIASSATSLTRQLLAFGRRQVIQPELIDLNVLVANMGKMLNRVIGEDIEFETTFSTYSEYIKADPGQIEQVLMNLVVNSRDAMPEGGKLAIKIESVVISEGTVSKAFQVKPGKYVLTSITDTGKGIDKDKLDHIFEPFYTTKDEGTGLGLSVVYGIVKQHNGFLNVYSEPGKGSTFKVYLPVYTTEQEVKLEKEVRSNELQGSGERILFVEDQNKIRTIICKVLREKGYVVFEAANANEAVNIYNVEHGEFDIVVSDVVLPGKSGVELIEELQAQNPKLSILLTSGYADEKSRWISIKEKGYHFLKKPYTTRELLKVIKEVIKE